MAKRGAQSDLNHDNWNEEEEPEEAGKFAQASEDELKKRVIKTARRRVTPAENSTASSTVFSGFKGFSAVTSTPATVKTTESASPFSFLTGLSKPSWPSAATGTIGSATTSALGASIFATTDPSKKIFSGFGSPPKESATVTTANKDDDTKDADYAASIKALNQAFASWISDKVKENALCKLTPIFKDYEKYLDEIESKRKQTVTKDTDIKSPPSSTGSALSSAKITPSTDAPAKTFSFGFSNSATASTAVGTGFTFANVAKPETKGTDSKTEEKADGDDPEEDEPPKVEFTPVEEKDSLYSQRCKLFVKVDGNYSDRGVGTLHIKKVDTKVQVLVRADTSLGNILLNIILNEAVPLQRMGKNNVMMICLPTPESKPPPTSVLLRVKTGEEADELFGTLSKYKPK